MWFKNLAYLPFKAVRIDLSQEQLQELLHGAGCSLPLCVLMSRYRVGWAGGGCRVRSQASVTKIPVA